MQLIIGPEMAERSLGRKRDSTLRNSISGSASMFVIYDERPAVSV